MKRWCFFELTLSGSDGYGVYGGAWKMVVVVVVMEEIKFCG